VDTHHPSALKPVDFSSAPFLVIWETTRSCGLACQHCRAEAILRRAPDELNTEEGKQIIDQVAAMKTPILILSGGDALMREDLEELIIYGKSRGLRMATIPAATHLLTRERVRSLKDAGLDQMAFSIDGPTAALHDGFRGVKGSFSKTLEGVAYAHEAGLPLQINTCFAAWNYPYLEDLVTLIRSLGVVFWEVFFLIPMGRGTAMQSLTAEQFETVFERMRRLNDEEPFIVKLTEAQHYRRFVIQKERGKGSASAQANSEVRRVLARPRGVGGAIGMSPQAVNSGKGFAFIDYQGNICPSGFLPIPAGNIRTHSLAGVYRDSLLFQQLRDSHLLKGKCRRCEFSVICGGSRARAYAVTGDYLASDPFCVYEPAMRQPI
jgi:radical SAM protein